MVQNGRIYYSGLGKHFYGGLVVYVTGLAPFYLISWLNIALWSLAYSSVVLVQNHLTCGCRDATTADDNDTKCGSWYQENRNTSHQGVTEAKLLSCAHVLAT